MKLLILFTLLSHYQYSNIAHLSGYYSYDGIYYHFKPCYKDETKYLVLKDDIDIIVAHLEKKHNTSMTLISTPRCNIWSSLVRKDGLFHELMMVSVTEDGINFYFEVYFRRYKD